MDKAGVHTTAAFKRIRQKWESTHNVLLLGSEDRSDEGIPSVPGGFGACGAPNDALHQFVHCLTRSYRKLALGMSDSPMLPSS